MPSLRLHAFLPASRANGPGVRAVIWVQGCSLHCPACFNPGTHDPRGGSLVSTAQLARRVLALTDRIDGLTISGGEPMQQAAAVLDLLLRVRAASDLGVVVFTGYTWSEVERRPRAAELLACTDVLIAGRYVAARRTTSGLRGSANQTVHLLTDRYRREDIERVPVGEVVIGADGEVTVSGIDPVRW